MSFLDKLFGSKVKTTFAQNQNIDATFINSKIKNIESLADLNVQQSEIENLNLKYPNQYLILLTAGNIFEQSKNYEKAIFYYSEATKVAERVIDRDITYFNLGETYLKMKKYQDAIRTFQTGIELNKYNLICNYGLGDVYMQLADYPRARDYYLKFYAINRKKDSAFSDDNVATNLGYIEYRLNNIKMACKYFSEAISINPIKSEPYIYLSQLYHSTRQFDLLKNLLEDAHQKFPDDYRILSAYANVRMIFRNEYSIKETSDYAYKAYKLNSDDKDTRFVYASIIIDDITEGIDSGRSKLSKSSAATLVRMIGIHEQTLLMDVDNTERKKIYLSLALGYIFLGNEEKYEYYTLQSEKI